MQCHPSELSEGGGSSIVACRAAGKAFLRLRAVGRLSRADAETEFGIGAKQAKRLLSEVTSQGRVQFVRKPHPGHYELVKGDVPACAGGL